MVFVRYVGVGTDATGDVADHIRHPCDPNLYQSLPTVSEGTLHGVTNNGIISRDVDKRGGQQGVPVCHEGASTGITFSTLCRFPSLPRPAARSDSSIV